MAANFHIFMMLAVQWRKKRKKRYHPRWQISINCRKIHCLCSQTHRHSVAPAAVPEKCIYCLYSGRRLANVFCHTSCPSSIWLFFSYRATFNFVFLCCLATWIISGVCMERFAIIHSSALSVKWLSPIVEHTRHRDEAENVLSECSRQIIAY